MGPGFAFFWGSSARTCYNVNHSSLLGSAKCPLPYTRVVKMKYMPNAACGMQVVSMQGAQFQIVSRPETEHELPVCRIRLASLQDVNASCQCA